MSAVTRADRNKLQLPSDLLAQAQELARTQGYPLSTFVVSAVQTAWKAAERGHGALLPRRLSRTGTATEVTEFRYPLAAAEQARAVAAIEAAGSSVRQVVVVALTAYVEAGGRWVDTVLPGERRLSTRAA